MNHPSQPPPLPFPFILFDTYSPFPYPRLPFPRKTSLAIVILLALNNNVLCETCWSYPSTEWYALQDKERVKRIGRIAMEGKLKARMCHGRQALIGAYQNRFVPSKI